MNEDMTDYVILSVMNPAFKVNIDAMSQTIVNVGGTSPSFIERFMDGSQIPNTDPPEYHQVPIIGFNPMVGTKEGVPGRIMMHFRMPLYYNANDLILFLQEGMGNPKPPVSVESIRSAYKILWIDDGLDPEGNPIGHYEYEITVQAKRAKFLPYMSEDVDGNNNEFLSGYLGTEPIELT